MAGGARAVREAGPGELEALVARLQSSFRLYGYVAREGRVAFGEVQSPGELLLFRDHEDGFAATWHSPKMLLYPPVLPLARVSRDLRAEPAVEDLGSVALVGVKPCDLAAVRALDALFEANKNPYYWARRLAVKFVLVEECLRPSRWCFCGSLGTGPQAASGFDLAVARVGDRYLLRAGSGRGEAVLRGIGLGEARGELVSEYDRLIGEAKRATSRLDVGAAERLLVERAGDAELWKAVSSSCVGCSSCNMVCPTCFCGEVVDEVDESGARRLLVQVGCLSYTYGLTASYHFRKELYTRLRHFVLHKLVFFEKQAGVPGCVGCGRCGAWCPMGLGLPAILEEVARRA